MVAITYNSVNPFSGLPTPFVSINTDQIYYGPRWGQKDSITLNGQITGCDFIAMVDRCNSLKSSFFESYKQFVINDGSEVYSALGKVLNFNVPEQQFSRILNYQIELEGVSPDMFSGYYGILEPKDVWRIEDTDDYKKNIIHTVSCVGFQTDQPAMTNAENWVNDKIGGLSSIPSIISSSIPNFNTGNICQFQTVYSKSRLNSSFEATESFTIDSVRNGYGEVRYTVSIESGINNDFINVNVDGYIDGCDYSGDSAYKTLTGGFDAYGAAVLHYGKRDLNPKPISASLNQNKTRLDFSYSYDNNNLPESYFDYTVTVSSGDRTEVSINGSVVSRGLSKDDQLKKSLEFISGGLPKDLFSLAMESYEFTENNKIINEIAISSGNSANYENGSVSLSASFDDRRIVNGFHFFDYTVNISPPINTFDAQKTIDGEGVYSVVDLGFSTKASMSINGSAKIIDGYGTAVDLVKQEIQKIFLENIIEGDAIIESKSIEPSIHDSNLVNFNVVYTFINGSSVAGADYATIENL